MTEKSKKLVRDLLRVVGRLEKSQETLLINEMCFDWVNGCGHSQPNKTYLCGLFLGASIGFKPRCLKVVERAPTCLIPLNLSVVNGSNASVYVLP